jgi:hypothetical protein
MASLVLLTLRSKDDMDKIKNAVKAEFKAQKANTHAKPKCPHCGKPIDFEFQHTQNTTVETKLVAIKKG